MCMVYLDVDFCILIFSYSLYVGIVKNIEEFFVLLWCKECFLIFLFGI